MASRAPNTRPIVIRKIKKISGGHHGGAWKVAYADFVTAMMAFFMLLWLISNPDKERLHGLAEYFTPNEASGSALGNGDKTGGSGQPTNNDSASQNGIPAMDVQSQGVARGGSANIPDAALRVLAQELRIALDADPQESAQKTSNIKAEDDALRITLMDSAKLPMFRPGTATLNDFARKRLELVGEKLAKSGARLTVEGHTDGVGGDSEANWRLSGERALAARGALLAGGMTPDRIGGAVAMGGSEPLYPDQPDRAENRRITVVVKGEASSLPADASFRF